ncbi:MAG TPA: DUF1688 family protein [Polyangia bacterium]|nr:DUF1688 family protein [Polyangia bacterium]
MTPPLPTPSDAEAAEARYLATPRAVRDRAEALYLLGARGDLAHFAIDESKLTALAERVLRVSQATYPDVRAIPDHTRFRHFGVGGIDRVAQLDARLAGLSIEDRLCAKFELAITSVLLDAGAGERWAFREPGGEAYTRSEGLAVASYHLFVGGVLSDDPAHAPHRADARALAHFSADDLARAFQVGPDNPLVGLDGRASILRRLGEVISHRPEVFNPAGSGGGATPPRLGRLGVHLASQAREGALPAGAVLGAVLDVLGDIWPGREVCAGRNLGDVWTHPAVGRVPFHKLSQWLTYSLCEPLAQYGVRITASSELTGLAEYRNGGLFVDGGVLVPKHPRVLSETHDVSSSLVVEWRALTVALLDRIAVEMRRLLGLHPDELSLAQVLEGGTWRAGRELARERRPDGAPPIRVHSDGTVF